MNSLPPLPKLPPGRPSQTNRERYYSECVDFAGWLKDYDRNRPDPTASRSWAYLAEVEGLITKDQFDQFNNLLSTLRENSYLPIDFVARDVSRTVGNLDEFYDTSSVEAQCDSLIWYVQNAHDSYTPFSPLDSEYRDTYIEVMVEKIDLFNLFKRECRYWSIPITSAKGWSDFNSRVGILRRMEEHNDKRRVLLYCGDFDPAGVQISDTIEANLRKLDGTWTRDGVEIVFPENLEIERFGLNLDFIEEHNLTWIDNLITSSGKSLANRKHPDHNKPYVQDWLMTIGERKVEANAMVTIPEASGRLMRDTIEQYLDKDGIARWENDVDEARAEMAEEMPKRLKAAFGN